LVRFFLSPVVAAVFLPASFFSVAGALPAGALPAVGALDAVGFGGILNVNLSRVDLKSDVIWKA